ncbi:hypothetical protein TeGR_g89 [Tetraparma gracilis]|uniref:Uncharacterized protein n=1 Tax=Tetraparma gracilis TaxID=2962635 RepID=A0ABQ6ML84_9STRA|nr:hypothetical protein TeGR_g89 [Tetraparma gracilis]
MPGENAFKLARRLSQITNDDLNNDVTNEYSRSECDAMRTALNGRIPFDCRQYYLNRNGTRIAEVSPAKATAQAATQVAFEGAVGDEKARAVDNAAKGRPSHAQLQRRMTKHVR